MPYDYVTRDDLTQAGQALYSRGYRGDELTSKLEMVADDLEYRRFKERSLGGIVPTFLKSLVSSTPAVAGDILKGAAIYTPGEEGDEALQKAGDWMGNFAPLWRREAMEKGAGPKLGKGAGETWAAMLGQQIPVSTTAYKAAEASVVAGTTISMATGGPDPSDLAVMAMSMTGATIPMAALEASSFEEASEDLGIDNDILTKWARQYGLASGVIEQLQSLSFLGPWFKGTKFGGKILPKLAMDKILKPLAKAPPVVKFLGTELSETVTEGLEEVSQAAIFNKMLTVAVAEQNERNKAKGLPLIDDQSVRDLSEGLADSFAAGFGLGMIMRGGGHVRNQTRKSLAAQQEKVLAGEDTSRYNPIAWYYKKQAAKEAEAFESIASGELTPELTEAPSAAPTGEGTRATEARTEMTPQQVETWVDDLGEGYRRQVARAKKIDIKGKTDEDIRAALLDYLDKHKEGPKFDYNDDGSVVMEEVDYALRKRETKALLALAETPAGEEVGQEVRRKGRQEKAEAFRALQKKIADKADQITRFESKDLVKNKERSGVLADIRKKLRRKLKKNVKRGLLTKREKTKVAIKKTEQKYKELQRQFSNLQGDADAIHETDPEFFDLVAQGKDRRPKLVINKPVVNPVPAAEAAQGKKLDDILRGVIKATQSDFGIWLINFRKAVGGLGTKEGRETFKDVQEQGEQLGLSPQEMRGFKEQVEATGRVTDYTDEQRAALALDLNTKRAMLRGMRNTALSKVDGIGDALATELLNREPTKLGEATTLAQVLTRAQYAQYVSELQGMLYDYARKYSAKDTENKIINRVEGNLQSRLDQQLYKSTIKLRDNTSFDSTQLPTKAKIPAVRRFMAAFPSLEDVARRLNMHSQFMAADEALTTARNRYNDLYRTFKDAEGHIWSKVPRALRTGLPGRHMAEMLHFVMTGREQQNELARSLKLRANYKTFKVGKDDIRLNAELLERIVESSTEKSEQKIAEAVYQLKQDQRVLYQWFVTNGLIPPDKFRKKYAPVIRVYQDQNKEESVGLTEWIIKNKESHAATKALTDDDIASLSDLADSLASWSRLGYRTPAASKGFMEYARNADKAFQQLTVLADSRMLSDIYVRKALQRMMFGHMVPSISAIFAEANRHVTDSDQRTLNIVLNNYIESMMSIPDEYARMMRSKELAATTTTRVLNMSNKFIDKYNSHPLFKTLPRVQRVDPDAKTTAHDAMQTAMAFMYATTLGLPNLTSPVKNLTQGPLVIAAVGLRRYLNGMRLMLTDPSTIKELKEMNLRPERYMYDQAALERKGGVFNAYVKATLALFGMSDMVNVMSAASSGLIGWKELDFSQSKTLDHMDNMAIVDTLFPNKRSNRDDKKIMKGTKWAGVHSKSVAASVVDLIRSGKADQAKDLYLRYLVRMSQWHYGPGGRAGAHRNSLVRAAFMYSKWPIEYADWWAGAARKGMVGNYMQTVATQLFLASLFAGLGYKSWEWILAGPFPDEILPVGPLAQVVEKIMRILKGSAMAGTAEITPTAPADAADPHWTSVKRNFEDLFE